MASFKLSLFLLVSVLAFFLDSSPVLCDEEEETLFESINSYRQNLSHPKLEVSDKATCLADEIADELEDQPCENASDFYPGPDGSSTTKLPKFEKLVKKCKININTTKDGVVMPVCVPNLEPNAVLSNYTHSNHYAKYINSSKYTEAGVGSEHDWIVLILTTNTSSGDFSSATSLLPHACNGYHFMLFPLLFAALFILIN